MNSPQSSREAAEPAPPRQKTNLATSLHNRATTLLPSGARHICTDFFLRSIVKPRRF